MRWVGWVVLLMSGCAKPGGGAPMPTPTASQASAAALSVASAPAAAASTDALPVEPALALPSTSADAVIGNIAREPKSKLCEVVLDGLTVLRPCTGAVGEKPSSSVSTSSKRGNCLVTVGDLEIIRPCQGKPNERKAPAGKATAPSPKLCQRVEHTADGDIVTLRPCPN